MIPSLRTRSKLTDDTDSRHRRGAIPDDLSSIGVGTGSSAPPRPTVFSELPARGLPALANVTLAPRAPLRNELRLDHRALAATVPMRRRSEVSPAEMPLAGYLLARALDGRKVEGKDLERLRRANESVLEARALLAFGRGNTKEDNDQSRGEAYRRLDGARGLEAGPTGPSMATRAIWAGAGNCGEHAFLATFAHAARLDTGYNETVVLLGNRFIDHGWAESVIPRPWNLASLWKPDAEAIILDAWKDGPAVFAPDSTRTQGQWLGAFTYRRVASPQPELLADAKSAAQEIAREHDPRDLSAQPPPRWLLRNARSVVSEAFVGRVLPKPFSAEHVLEIVRKSSSAARPESLRPAMPADVRKEILAVGVARELMAAPEPLEHAPHGHGRVRSAAAQAPAVIATVGNLTKVTPRQHRPWLPSFAFHDLTFGKPEAPRMVRPRTDARTAIPSIHACGE